MNNKTGNYCVAAVAIKADLSGLTLEKNGVLNGALVGLPTTSNGVKYNETFQHKVLVTNEVGLKNTMINLRTVNKNYGDIQTTALVDKLITSTQDLFDTLVGAGQLPTSITKPDGMMNKAVLNFFYEKADNGQKVLKVGIYVYPKDNKADNTNIPDLSGSWSLNMKGLRLLDQNNPPTKFKYNDYKDVWVLNQDPNNKRFFSVVMSQNQELRPKKGFTNGMFYETITSDGASWWNLSIPDFDDNGIFNLTIKEQSNNVINEFLVNYTEAGYNINNKNQVPSVFHGNMTRLLNDRPDPIIEYTNPKKKSKQNKKKGCGCGGRK